jgi:hypothetical protein
MTTYTSPFTGQTINPAQVSYESLTISGSVTLQWPINGNTTNVVAGIIEVAATTAGSALVLPAATEVSVGTAFIVRNVGTAGNYAVTIQNYSGGTIISVPVAPTTATVNTYYIYLTNNDTLNGTWSTIAMGIGASAASASALAGSGLLAINTTLNENTPLTTFSSAYQFLNNDRAQLYVWTGGAGTATLPNVSTVGAGWFVIVKNDGTGILTVSTGSSAVIDAPAVNTTSIQVQIANSSVFVTDGTNWFTYALAQTNVFTYTQYIQPVGSIVSSPFTVTAANAKSVIQQYSGVLGLNLTVLLPPTVQLYSLRNITTGSYSLTFGIAGSAGTTLVVPQNQTIIAISDGTNLYNANSATTSFIAALSLGNGTAANPSLSFQSDATTGLFLAASGQLGFAVSGSQAGALTGTGLQLPVGINAGAF